ncbi:hypothetical protein QE177_07955 [Arsenophonus sp. aPb]|uniref:hypothetical protein n=1 Tax=Arsenophonus sp. aPb TaxID=3041619 RepID=UPI0024698A58|nr:hypothetical protein [Arsenophonus sp. aPb]WGL97172.1 hypothetical protein QE177_07955 [Arsenophonus sp. aPb]
MATRVAEVYRITITKGNYCRAGKSLMNTIDPKVGVYIDATRFPKTLGSAPI